MAVAKELKKRDPSSELVYIGQKGDGFADVVAKSGTVDKTLSVRAGKFRRYHSEGWKQLFDVPTVAKNLRDAGFVLVGFFQSYKLLKKIRPEVIFIKGGFVGVPVGLAAAALRIPFMTHDSDSTPGLANRIISRWATLHLVAMPKEIYPKYDPNRTIDVGVPVQTDFQQVTQKLQQKYRKKLGIKPNARVVLLTGGGQGAVRLNDALLAIVPTLLEIYPDLIIIHLAGQKHAGAVQSAYKKALKETGKIDRVLVKDYVSDMYRYSGAADVVITRAGATTLAEFAAQAKACVVIPSPYLTGGHQLKNAEYLAEKNAIVCVDERLLQSPEEGLETAVKNLLDTPENRQKLGDNLAGFVRTDAASRIAVVLLEQSLKQKIIKENDLQT